MGKTHKEQEDRLALTKNNGKNIRYRIRVQQEAEAKQEQQEAMREIKRNKYERNEYEDL